MAAGNSSRCGFDKLLKELHQKNVLATCLQTFQTATSIDDIWIVGKPVPNTGKIRGSITGGSSRFESVKAGLEHCKKFYEDEVRIIVHNAANPFLTISDLEMGLKQAENKTNLIFGFFTPNSIKQVKENGIVNKFLDREQIFETQTPQISTLENFNQALQIWSQKSSGSKKWEIADPGMHFSEPKDEAELLSLLNQPIHVFECQPNNTKITFASDFETNTNFKIGLGEDSHRFAKLFDPLKPLRLAGIDMSENHLSSDGNSDGDVILHALCNALLSAFGDKTFDPIAAPICAAGETNSTTYLKATQAHLANQNHELKVQQVLVSLEGSQPKIAPHHEKLVNHLAELLDISPQCIGLTYTTGEGLSEVGKGFGIRSFVLVTLKA